MNAMNLTRTPLNLDRVAVPTDVRVEGDSILWARDESNMSDPLEGFVLGAPIERTIWEFLELRDASAHEIAAFARNYGVLGIRSDGLPGIAPDVRSSNSFLKRIEDEYGVWFVERWTLWRMYSVALRAVLAASIEIRDNQSPDWSTFEERWDLDRFTWKSFDLPTNNQPEGKVTDYFLTWTQRLWPGRLVHHLQQRDSEYQRQWLATHLSDSWVQWSNVTPRLSWDPDEPLMTLELTTVSFLNGWPTNSLFPVLVSQLMQVLSGPEFGRMTQCSICGRIFLQQIKTGRHERTYCDEHKIEAQREKKRRWARKKAEAKKAKVSD
jgi:hypothetical protein